jgi:hypothetical protein
MGAHVHSIYQISPNARYGLYAFVYGIPPWTDAFDWIEENFVRVSSALATDGLLVMSDHDLKDEIGGAYAEIDKRIRNLPLYFSGFVVANLNPHSVDQENDDATIFALRVDPNDPKSVSNVCTAIVKAAKGGDLSLLQQIAEPLDDKSSKSLVRIVIENLVAKPTFAGFGIDFKNLADQLHARRRDRRARSGRFRGVLEGDDHEK